MRPQRNAAENMDAEMTLAIDRLASMRPQRNAAENSPDISRPLLATYTLQ